TYLLVRVKFGKPAIFIQKRVGKDGKIFDLYKFRTMTDQRGEDGKLLPDDQRLTSFGKKLRSTSLDELPELFNVLKGDMALIGPRPLLVKYLPLYNDEQARRHEVRPGLTGYAQVNGRNTITWEDRLKLDVEYVDNVTFLNDWKIIFKTIKTVFKREGISEKGSATMDEFKGNGHRV
ncbi:sugar transferase, partial [Ligilactobacillus salivarius]